MHGLNVSQYNLVIQGLFTEENDQLGIPILRERSNTLFNNVFEKLKATRVGKKLNIKWNAELIERFWLEIPGRPLDENEKAAVAKKARRLKEKEDKLYQNAVNKDNADAIQREILLNKKKYDTNLSRARQQAQDLVNMFSKTISGKSLGISMWHDGRCGGENHFLQSYDSIH